MNPNTILLLFFIIFILEYLVSTMLTIMNLNSSLSNRNSIPSFIAHVLSVRQYDRSVDYSQRKGRFSLVTSAISTLATGTVILLTVPAKILIWIEGFSLSPFVEGAAYLLLLSALSTLMMLPFSLYSQFIIEEEFGFNKMSFKLYFSDMVKSAIISLVLFIPLIFILFLFMDKSGDLWWIYAYLFFTAFQFLIAVLYPLVIAPLFNKFSELDDGPLKDRLTELAKKTSFKAKGIYKMDGSRRSSHSNAYFTGFGKARRIVLFDTLLDNLSDEEIEAVLAHEIGHFRKKHILKSMILSLLLAFLIFFVLSLLMSYEPLYSAFGFSKPSLPAIIVILSFLMGPLSFFIKPLFSLMSRKNEYEADRFAFDATGTSEPLVSALITLGKDNLSNLTPHKAYSAFHYSHPVLSERIEALEKLK